MLQRSAPHQGSLPGHLWEGALAVLCANDLGHWTKPAPRLYPHQWTWDSAFIAIGLARVDPDRALREVESPFLAQWADGRVPHIVYNPAAPPEAYFPDAARWACADRSPAAPRAPATSGLSTPPVHALATWHICEVIGDLGPFLPQLRGLYAKLVAWHRYLATARDPDGSGLLTIYHPWESGTDNSPRWDAPLAQVEVGDLPSFVRRDLQHVADPSHRPTDAEYDRYLWLIELLKAARYDDAVIHRGYPFLVKDMLASAIFAAANQALAHLADRLGAPDAEREQLAAWAERFGRAVERHWDPDVSLALDVDLLTGQPIRVQTCAGLAPLMVPGLRADLARTAADRLAGPEFAGSPDFAFAVVPSAVPGSPGYDSRSYWRGPTWPFANWLFWWALRQHGFEQAAAALRAANLALLDRPEAHFAEYFEPFTAEPLGSLDQSWTAAVALDWLAADPWGRDS